MTREEMIADYKRHRAEIARESQCAFILMISFVGVVLALVVTIRVLVWTGVMTEGGEHAQGKPEVEARP